MEKFDILFLCHEKDMDILKKNMEYAKKNVLGYHKIFVLSKENYFSNEKDVTFIDEKIFPFDKKTIGIYAPEGRAGWYYQQFLKLYFLNVTGEKVLDNVLVIDADVMFIKKTKFFENGKPLYNFEIGYHQPYYKIMERVFGFGKQNSKYSGTVHHMLYQRKYINELLKDVLEKKGKELWQVIMENIDVNTVSGFSEQDLYFNYMLHKHPDKIKIRRIRFIDFPLSNLMWIKIFDFLGYSYIASHDYLKKQKFAVIRSLTIAFLTRIGIKRFLKEMLIKFKIISEK